MGFFKFIFTCLILAYPSGKNSEYSTIGYIGILLFLVMVFIIGEIFKRCRLLVYPNTHLIAIVLSSLLLLIYFGVIYLLKYA